MKKIIIVNNNMDSGGIQKALVNLLKATANEYEITLLLFSKTGALMSDIPQNVRVITPCCVYRMLGLVKNKLASLPHLFLFKAFLKAVTKFFGKKTAMKILGIFQKKIVGYDIAISYSHMTHYRSFDNGCAEFVLDKIKAHRKVCFVHCDYKGSGLSCPENNTAYHLFDNIVCVSESVREQFLSVIPDIADKTVTLRNFCDFNIIEQASHQSVKYDAENINIVTVARLSPEKGIERAIEAIKDSRRDDIVLHIVGDGPQREMLGNLCESIGISSQVHFYGEQKNPYKYMIKADYLLVSSYHEAAPMVFDEAHILGLPIISTRLLSSAEMLDIRDIECENSKEGITQVIKNLKKSSTSEKSVVSNQKTLESFSKFIDGRV